MLNANYVLRILIVLKTILVIRNILFSVLPGAKPMNIIILKQL